MGNFRDQVIRTEDLAFPSTQTNPPLLHVTENGAGGADQGQFTNLVTNGGTTVEFFDEQTGPNLANAFL